MPFFKYHFSGAYGRRYNNITDLRKDFYDGKDFRVEGIGMDAYGSIRDVPEGYSVQMRYGKYNQKTTMLKVG